MQWAVRAPSKRQIDNEQLDAKIFALHHSSNKSYGRPRIVDALRRANVRIGHERVRRSLVRQHLKTVHKRPYTITTDSEHTQPIAPNLLQRRFNGWQLNQAWVGDITFIDTQEGWLYLAVSRRAHCWDNAVAERFFKTLKVERVYQTQYPTRQEARLDIANWIEGFYNAKRLRIAIGGKIPNQLEQALKAV